MNIESFIGIIFPFGDVSVEIIQKYQHGFWSF